MFNHLHLFVFRLHSRRWIQRVKRRKERSGHHEWSTQYSLSSHMSLTSITHAPDGNVDLFKYVSDWQLQQARQAAPPNGRAPWMTWFFVHLNQTFVHPRFSTSFFKGGRIRKSHLIILHHWFQRWADLINKICLDSKSLQSCCDILLFLGQKLNKPLTTLQGFGIKTNLVDQICSSLESMM